MKKFKIVILLYILCMPLKEYAQVYTGIRQLYENIFQRDVEFPENIRFNDSTFLFSLTKSEKILLVHENGYLLTNLELQGQLDINSNMILWSAGKSRIAMNGDVVSKWELNNRTKQWLQKSSASPLFVSGRKKLWFIDSTTAFIQFNDKMNYAFHLTHNLKVYNLNIGNIIAINDSTSLHYLNDSIIFYVRNDYKKILKQLPCPDLYEVGQNTKIWSLTPDYEFWVTQKSRNIWSYNNNSFKWSKVDSILPVPVNDTSECWILPQDKYLFYSIDTLSLWEVYSKKKLWPLNDTLLGLIYTDDILCKLQKKETVEQIIPKSIIRPQPKQYKISENTKFWQLNDSTMYWEYPDSSQVWTMESDPVPWEINDTTFLITINDTLRCSKYEGEHMFWKYIDSLSQWEHYKAPRPIDFSDSLKVWKLGHTLYYTRLFDNYKVIAAHSRVSKINKYNCDTIFIINDSTSIWSINDSLKLWESGEKSEIWELDTIRNFFKLDSTAQFLKLNEKTRISIIEDSLVVWPNNLIYDEIPIDAIRELVILNDTTVIFKAPLKAQVWTKKKNSQVHYLNDSVRVYTWPEKKKSKKVAKPLYWSMGGTGSINFSQGLYENWKKGGETNIAMLSVLNLFGNYEKNKTKFSNSVELKLGALNPSKKGWQKNEDEIELDSRFGRKAFNHWYYTVSFNAKSQGFKGFKYSDKDTVLVSNFLSPATINLGIGMDFTPSKKISLFISPLNSKLTYVKDTAILDQTAYGVKEMEKSRIESGFQLKSKVKLNITDLILFENKLDLFSNYSEHPENIDVNWQVLIVMKVHKHINSTVSSHLIYDDDIRFPETRLVDGEEITKQVPRIQFKEILSIGFSYQF